MRPAKRLALPWLLFKKHAVWSACSSAPCALERVLLAGPWLDRNCARVRDATGALETRVGCTLGADGLFVPGIGCTLGTAGLSGTLGAGRAVVACTLVPDCLITSVPHSLHASRYAAGHPPFSARRLASKAATLSLWSRWPQLSSPLGGWRRGDRRSGSSDGCLLARERGILLAWCNVLGAGKRARSGCCAVRRLVTSASCSRSFMLTPVLAAPAVAPFVMLLIASTKLAKALVTRSPWLTVGRVMLLCWNSTVSESRSALVACMYALCVQ